VDDVLRAFGPKGKHVLVVDAGGVQLADDVGRAVKRDIIAIQRVLSGALAGDAEALASIARYIFHKLEDIEWAKPYFEEALAAGETSVIYDLVVLAIFLAMRSTPE
jgi:hypothetical protein